MLSIPGTCATALSEGHQETINGGAGHTVASGFTKDYGDSDSLNTMMSVTCVLGTRVAGDACGAKVSGMACRAYRSLVANTARVHEQAC